MTVDDIVNAPYAGTLWLPQINGVPIVDGRVPGQYLVLLADSRTSALRLGRWLRKGDLDRCYGAVEFCPLIVSALIADLSPNTIEWSHVTDEVLETLEEIDARGIEEEVLAQRDQDVADAAGGEDF